MVKIAKMIKETEATFLAILVIGLIGIVFLIVFGNLSGNLGFAAGTQGANDTDAVIGNLTAGAVSFFSLAPTWFILLAVVLLIIIVFGLVGVVRSRSAEGNFSN